MKDRLRALVSPDRDEHANRWAVREYLQHYVLYMLFRRKHYVRLVFTGGTALRMFFDLPRFSEDLDFSLAEGEGDLDFGAVRSDLLMELAQAGYRVAEKPSESRTVVSMFIKFGGLLYELGLTAHADEVLSVKLEVDTNPPAGGRTEIGLVNVYHMMYHVVHYDLLTLFAGKLHALCFRPHLKGRDLYDLLWFLSSQGGVEPNLQFLNNAAAQTESEPPRFERDNWRSLVMGRLGKIELDRAREEIRPFLERPEEADFLTLDNFRRLLRR